MKLTTARLKRLIKEELEAVMQKTDLNEILDTETAIEKVNQMYKDGEFDETERRSRVKQIQQQNYARLNAMGKQARAAERAKDPNYNVGLFGGDSQEEEHGTYTDPKVTTYTPSAKHAAARKKIMNMFDDLSKKLGGNEAVYKKLADVSGGKYTKEKAIKDYAEIKFPVNDTRLGNIGKRFGGYLQTALSEPEKKPGFFASLRSKLPFEE